MSPNRGGDGVRIGGGQVAEAGRGRGWCGLCQSRVGSEPCAQVVRQVLRAETAFGGVAEDVLHPVVAGDNDKGDAFLAVDVPCGRLGAGRALFRRVKKFRCGNQGEPAACAFHRAGPGVQEVFGNGSGLSLGTWGGIGGSGEPDGRGVQKENDLFHFHVRNSFV